MVFGLACFFLNDAHPTAFCADTLPQGKIYALSQQQVLDNFGKDDTARAVINYFFLRRRKATKGLLPYSLITTGASILYATSIVGKSAGTVLVVGTVVISVTLIFGMLLLTDCIDLLKFSRRRLFKLLGTYFAGKGIPRRLKRKLYRQKWRF